MRVVLDVSTTQLYSLSKFALRRAEELRAHVIKEEAEHPEEPRTAASAMTLVSADEWEHLSGVLDPNQRGQKRGRRRSLH